MKDKTKATLRRSGLQRLGMSLTDARKLIADLAEVGYEPWIDPEEIDAIMVRGATR